MEKSNLYVEERKIFIELQKKFDFYILGISVALLSLSIQSTQHDDSCWCNFIIICAWLFLFISILLGFWRLEKLVLSYSASVDVLEAIHIKQKQWDSKYVVDGNSYIDKEGDKMAKIYKWQKFFLLLSLVFFIVFKSISITYPNNKPKSTNSDKVSTSFRENLKG